MSSSTRPIRTSAALALSLGLHALLVSFGILSGPGSPTQPKSAEVRSILAQKKLVQLTEIANQLEALTKQPLQETPPPPSAAQAQQAMKRALSDSQDARKALGALEQSVGKPELASRAFEALKQRTEQAQKSQAEAFQVLDQQLQAAAQKPEAVALRAALAKQVAAQLATKRAEEQQRRLPPQTDKAGLEKALSEAKAAHDEAIKALGEAKQEQERAQKYERLAQQSQLARAMPGSSGERLDTMEEILQAAQNASAKIEALAKSLGLPVAESPQGEGSGEPDLDKLTARAQRLLSQAQQRPGSQAAAFLAAAQQGSKRAGDLTGFMGTSGKRDGGIVRRRGPGEPRGGFETAAPTLKSGFEKNAVAGRSLTTQTGPGVGGAEWMFVDSWYVLGPFPNPNRQNIDTAFGPEKLLDLDASYPGKGGKTISWAFHQAKSAEVRPPVSQEYAVYYFYTELNFEEAGDHWIAIGSDDKSHLWLNGQTVWVSSTNLKGWQAGEGLRRVHFQKGKNRLLLRVENGWLGVGASLVIRVR